MDTIIKNCHDNKVSISDYLCSLAEKDYLSQTKEVNTDVSSLSRIEKALFFMFQKLDGAAELLRQYNNREITEEDIISIYLKIYGYKIQLENTEKISDLLEIVNIGNLIYSKRDTMSHLAIDRAKGILIDRLKETEHKKQQEKQKQLLKEQEEKKFQEWNKKYNGRYPRHFMSIYRPEEYEEQLKIHKEGILTDEEMKRVIEEEP